MDELDMIVSAKMALILFKQPDRKRKAKCKTQRKKTTQKRNAENPLLQTENAI